MLGMTHEEIELIEGHDRGTIAKHCRAELDKGKSDAKAMVITSLFNNIKKGKEASIFFWLKCQARWSEQAFKKELEEKQNDLKIRIIVDE